MIFFFFLVQKSREKSMGEPEDHLTKRLCVSDCNQEGDKCIMNIIYCNQFVALMVPRLTSMCIYPLSLPNI